MVRRLSLLQDRVEVELDLFGEMEPSHVITIESLGEAQTVQGGGTRAWIVVESHVVIGHPRLVEKARQVQVDRSSFFLEQLAVKRRCILANEKFKRSLAQFFWLSI